MNNNRSKNADHFLISHFLFLISFISHFSFKKVAPFSGADLFYNIVAAPAPDRAATRTRTTSSTTFHQLIFFMPFRNLWL